MTYQYRCKQIGETYDETERLLNDMSSKGWEFVCPYASDNEWLIFRRKITGRKK